MKDKTIIIIYKKGHKEIKPLPLVISYTMPIKMAARQKSILFLKSPSVLYFFPALLHYYAQTTFKELRQQQHHKVIVVVVVHKRSGMQLTTTLKTKNLRACMRFTFPLLIKIHTIIYNIHLFT